MIRSFFGNSNHKLRATFWDSCVPFTLFSVGSSLVLYTKQSDGRSLTIIPTGYSSGFIIQIVGTLCWLKRVMHSILGDPGAISRVAREKRKKPLGTDSHRAISKNSSGCRLLIGYKKCFVLLCPIGEQFLPSSFREFVNDGYCLATLARFVHQACANKGNFYFLLS